MATILPFVPQGRGGSNQRIAFSRAELNRIVSVYGRMVAAGLWKDYAIELGDGGAAFWCFRRAAERPEYRIEKRMDARGGPWSLIDEGGRIVRRGEALGPILAPIERRLLKAVKN